MRKLLVILAVLVGLYALPALGQCVACIAMACQDGGRHTVCDDIPPPGHGCIASGTCPQGPFGCVRNLALRVATVEIITPPAMNPFFTPALRRTYVALLQDVNQRLKPA